MQNPGERSNNADTAVDAVQAETGPTDYFAAPSAVAADPNTPYTNASLAFSSDTIPGSAGANRRKLERRFHASCYPVDRWLVWDNEDSCHAIFGGEPLIGLTHRSACQLADILNEIYGSRTPAPSRR